MSDTNGRRQYSNEDILDAIRRVDAENEKVTIDTYNSTDDVPSSSVVIERFGSWVDAKEEAGVGGDGRESNARPREYSTQEMIEMLRECAERHERASQSLFDGDDDFCASGTIVKRFGSWGQAKKEAGLVEEASA